jgi:DNA replication ATP-dependent helicase Dna2
MNRFLYNLRRDDTSTSHNSFLNSQITINDPIVISEEQGHFALANGFVLNIQPNVLSVQVDRQLRGARHRQPGFDAVCNQVFNGIVDLSQNGEANVTSNTAVDTTTGVKFRIDKDEFKSGLALARTNILQLLSKSGDTKRRELIVHQRGPRFCSLSEIQDKCSVLNEDQLNPVQREAIRKVLTGNLSYNSTSY